MSATLVKQAEIPLFGFSYKLDDSLRLKEISEIKESARSSKNNIVEEPSSSTNLSIQKSIIVDATSKSTGLKSVDQLIARYKLRLPKLGTETVNNPFQKTTFLFGQDDSLDFMNLPFCIYRILNEAASEERFILHRFYLPHKNGVRFATYLLNQNGKVLESVCYQRNTKYSSAFKTIRAEINKYSKIEDTFAA